MLAANKEPQKLNPILFSREHHTPLGTILTCWSELGLFALHWDRNEFVHHDSFPENELLSSKAEAFDDAVDRFFQCGEDHFGEVTIDPSGWTPFMNRIYRACRQIPCGQTWSYAQLAGRAGNKKASRAVGAAMARNRVPLVIPCHRVVASSGKLQGFSALGGIQTKQRLIDLEQTGVWV